MKKIIMVALCAMFMCAFAKSQETYTVENGAVVFTKVFENTGKSVEEMHTAMVAFFARVYNDVTSTEKLNQNDHLIYKGVFANTGSYQMGNYTIDVPYTLDVAIKENRMRVHISITTGAYRGVYNAYSSEYNIVEAAPLGICKQTKYIKKETANTFEVVQKRCVDMLSSIETELTQNEANNDDW